MARDDQYRSVTLYPLPPGMRTMYTEVMAQRPLWLNIRALLGAHKGQPKR